MVVCEQLWGMTSTLKSAVCWPSLWFMEVLLWASFLQHCTIVCLTTPQTTDLLCKTLETLLLHTKSDRWVLFFLILCFKTAVGLRCVITVNQMVVVHLINSKSALLDCRSKVNEGAETSNAVSVTVFGSSRLLAKNQQTLREGHAGGGCTKFLPDHQTTAASAEVGTLTYSCDG